ncbi:hypothetical protein [Duganella sp. HH105]|uniref:hypothetical protein n=1 Tax=Duganella sp. HH105 TaxID=1781067 RepID=UPI000877D9F0|nr:hypothetical protein [Duganella sp. HH105]OEZ60960.1 hypothetical protein DUGA6_26440 [Duganella sp. HH105]
MSKQSGFLIFVLAAALTACASAPTPAQLAMQHQSIDEFVVTTFPVKPPDAPASAGGYLARFTDADSAQLYWPKQQLTAYCAAHGGVMRVDRYFIGNAISPRHEERTPERSKLEHPYVVAAAEGALGIMRCKHSRSNKTLWGVEIQPGTFAMEAAAGKLQMNIVLPD